ncbi:MULTISPECIES: plasmid mobilization relaxosome protein MobC [unclassified Streptomyces]|uniref:plasmid mobilization relaxosome protein MobC n=1 Tax=unclassified Streptomyces TaxID=2593676 RepID=UPI0008DE87E8|nr:MULTISPECIES: plasmid mobilization relaxosome protein MobC [unclassified Streptomyces]OII60227.1 mobilization protein [Streptomyces sp. CC77]
MHDPNNELPTTQQEMPTGLNRAARYDVGPSKGRSNAEAFAPGVAEASPRREGAPGSGVVVRAADEAALHRVARRRARQDVQRKERVDVRYSVDEKTDILAEARRLGLAGAHLVGAIVMAHLNGDLALPGQRTATDDLIDELAALRTQVARIGTNVNQIAHRLNSGGDPHPVDTAVLSEAGRVLTLARQAVAAIDTAADVAATQRRAA